MAIKLQPIEMDRRKARKLAEEYKVVGSPETRSLTIQRDASINSTALAQIDAGLYQTYLALAEEGKRNKVIDIRQTFADAGQDSKQRPNLAIARADWRSVQCLRSFNGELRFSDPTATTDKYVPGPNKTYLIPRDTLPPIAGRFRRDGFTALSMVPAIPPKLRPDSLKDYAMIWEVFDWSGEPTPLPSRWSLFRSGVASRARGMVSTLDNLDPILLRPLGGPLYVVIAAWDLSPIEATIIGSL